MNPSETQSDSSPQETYFDTEVLDMSEQEFSASLETGDERPVFVVDSPGRVTAPENDQFIDKIDRRPPILNEFEGAHPSIANGATLPGTDPVETRDPEQYISSSASETQAQSDWRDQVSAKVKRYKTLKPRQERYPSLQLQFDTVVPWKSDKSTSAASERAEFSALPTAYSAPPIFEPDPPVPYPPSTEATARVLEFPRPGTLPFNRDELAEPVLDRPRIMEAPELLPPPPALGGIMIEPTNEPEPQRQPGVDMPLQTARLSHRMFAAAIDGLMVLCATVIFGYMFLRFNTSLPQMRVAVEVAAALTVTLWFAYQSAFLVFCGTTPGLRVARLKISRFDGAPASRNLRRCRVLVSMLSFVSLGLGYAWTFLDEDELSWHDRITKTHLSPR
jgi:uncharacterized RDD family membrane protein YckC